MDTPTINTAAQPSVVDLNDAADAMADVERAINRLVELSSKQAGKAALATHIPTILWQRCRLGNVLEQIGVPMLRAAS